MCTKAEFLLQIKLYYVELENYLLKETRQEAQAVLQANPKQSFLAQLQLGTLSSWNPQYLDQHWAFLP